jgi:hypothetical protein
LLTGCPPAETPGNGGGPPGDVPAEGGSQRTTTPSEISSPKTDDPNRPWTIVFGGGSLDGWRNIRGKARLRDGAMLLDGAKGQVLVVARGLDYTDGEIEIDVERLRAGDLDGPFTVSLRLALSLTWRCVNFVCYPRRVEALRSSWRNHHPPVEARETLGDAKGVERWRFVLDGGRIRGRRLGDGRLRYDDPKPASGSIGLTADGCRVLVHRVRYRPPAAEADD